MRQEEEYPTCDITHGAGVVGISTVLLCCISEQERDGRGILLYSQHDFSLKTGDTSGKKERNDELNASMNC